LYCVAGDLEREVRYVNSHSSLDEVPVAAGIEIDAGARAMSRPVKVFLVTRRRQDLVRPLYARLREDGFVPWLDEETIVP
jgi:hypothetical protein